MRDHQGKLVDMRPMVETAPGHQITCFLFPDVCYVSPARIYDEHEDAPKALNMNWEEESK